MDPYSVTIEAKGHPVFLLLEVCEVVVVSHALPTGLLLVIVVVNVYGALSFFVTNRCEDE